MRSPLARSVQGTVDVGALVEGYPLLMGAMDPGGLAQYVQIDALGNLKVSAASGPATAVVGTLSNNALVPGTNNLGVLPAVASINPITYTDQFQVLLNTDTRGFLRSRLPVDSITGNITAVSPGAGSTVTLMNTTGAGTVVIGLEAVAFTGTIQFEVSGDNANWVGIQTMFLDGGTWNTSQSLAGGLNRIAIASVQGIPNFRVRCSAYTSGTLVVSLWAGYGDGIGGNVASIGSLAGNNPNNALAVGAYLLAFNGAAQDRLRSAFAALSTGAGSLSVAPGIPPVTSLAAVVATGPGTAFPLGVCRSFLSMQVFGTATAYNVNLQGSLDGANYFNIGNAVVGPPSALVAPPTPTPAAFIRANVNSISGGNVTALLGAA